MLDPAAAASQARWPYSVGYKPPARGVGLTRAQAQARAGPGGPPVGPLKLALALASSESATEHGAQCHSVIVTARSVSAGCLGPEVVLMLVT